MQHRFLLHLFLFGLFLLSPCGLFAQPAYVFHEKGVALQKQGKCVEAIAEFDKAIKADASYFEAWCDRGRCQQALGKTDLAMADFNKTVVLNPNYAPGFYYRGKLQTQLGKDNEAIADFTKAIQLNPDFPDSYASRGQLYARIGKTGPALTDLNKAISFNGKDANLFFIRAGVYGVMNKPTEAIADYTTCTKLDATRGDAFFELGKLQAAQLNHTAAVAAFTQAIAQKVSGEEVYRLRAAANMALNKPAEALKDYSYIVDVLKTKDAAIIKQRGDCFVLQLNYVAAVKDYTRSLTLRRDDVPTLLARADAHYRTGKTKYALATNDYNAVLKLEPKNVMALRGLARILFETEKWAAAIEKLNEVINLKPEAVDYAMRGKCQFKAGNKKACCEDLSKAAQLGHPDAAKDKLQAGCN